MGKSSPLLNEFLASITPKKPFSAESIPGVPDYSNDESWAALPGKKSVALLHPPEEKIIITEMLIVFLCILQVFF